MIRELIRKLLAIAAVNVSCLSSANAAENRVALVIGNSEYAHVAELANPKNDAADIGKALTRLGFGVTVKLDLDYASMRISLRDFSEAAEDAEIALIYFAGHGIEIDKVNYLIPVNAELRSDRDIEFEAIRLDTVIGSVQDSGGVRIVLLDACRNNPFVADMVRTKASRSIGRGLARIDPGGVLVGYAARGGTIALDGDGRNSPYASALLSRIETPGIEIGKLFRLVRDAVLEKTDGYQEPFTYGSLPGKDIYFVPPATQAALAVPEEVSLFDEMLEDFAVAEKYGTIWLWRQFVQTYGQFEDNELVRLAVARKSELEAERETASRMASRPLWLEPEFDGRGQARLTREQSKLLQTSLAYLGHYRGRIDGSVGPQTRKAIALARLQLGLPAGTNVDAALLRVLPDVPATDALKSAEATVYAEDTLPPGLDPRLDHALRQFPNTPVLFDYFEGRLYLAVREREGTWNDASKAASRAGGHLAVISSSAENQFLIGLFSRDQKFIKKDSSGTLYGPVIGLFQVPGSAEPRGGWAWITGEPLSFTGWSPGNPDNFEGKQHYARFYTPSRFVRPGSVPRFWDDTRGNLWDLGYLVEIE